MKAKSEPFGFSDEDENAFGEDLKKEQGYMPKDDDSEETQGKRGDLLAILMRMKDGEIDEEEAADEIMECCGYSS